jgi:phage-related protein
MGGGVSTYGPPYFSTVENNVGHNPSGQFIYAITQLARTQDLVTINVAITGFASGQYPQFARGSLYAITGLGDSTYDTTGMVLNAYPAGPSSYTLQILNPGQQQSTTPISIGAINCPEPAWTTGFFWSPSYSSQWDVKLNVITAQFEPSYSQRSPQGLTSNTSTWTLNFNDRSDTEAKGIMAFVQNLGGVYSTPILIPPNRMYNNPTLKYLLTNPKVNTKSHTLSDVSVTATQVFDF